MKPWTVAQKMLPNDSRQILRDPMLALLMSIAVGVGVAARFALPAIDQGLAEAGVMPSEPGGARFSSTWPLWFVYLTLWNGALMPGTVFAFLLLDEKENDTLTAMRVTPIPFGAYLRYRVTLPTLLGLTFALTVAPITGIMGQQAHWWQFVLLAFPSALTAPIVTLALALFANDKVQGFALTKFTGIVGMLMIASWFIPAPWHWLTGIFPPVLLARAYWMVLEGDPLWWVAGLLGTAAQIATVLALLGAFQKRV